MQAYIETYIFRRVPATSINVKKTASDTLASESDKEEMTFSLSLSQTSVVTRDKTKPVCVGSPWTESQLRL